MKTISQIASELGKLVEAKNAAYGDSFDKAGDFLKLLYPQGISPNQYSDMLCLVRIFDKQMRIATNKGAFGENPYNDIAGYGLLGCRRYENEEERKETLEKIVKMEQELRKKATVVQPQVKTTSFNDFATQDDEIAMSLWKDMEKHAG